MVFSSFTFPFLEHWRLFCVDWRFCCKNTSENIFCRLWNEFTTFAVVLLEHRTLLCVDWRYSCPVTGENIYFPALKLGLRPLQFFFKNIGCYYASIGGTVVKMQAKTFIRLLWYWFYGVLCSGFRTLEVLLPRLEVQLQIYRRKSFFASL